MAFLFYDEFGVEPVAYIGYPKDIKDLTIENVIHESIVPAIQLQKLNIVINSTHNLYQSVITPIIVLTDNFSTIHTQSIAAPIKLQRIIQVYDAIHSMYQYNQINAPVSFSCRTYLQTPYENRILETPIIKC